MFNKFGEFDSADEMNRAAAAQRKEGDNEAIRIRRAHGQAPGDGENDADHIR